MTRPREVIRLREIRFGHKVTTELKVSDITHFIAGQKYVTAYFPGGEQLITDSIVKLEKEFGEEFISPHRAVLVRKSLVAFMCRGIGELFLYGVDRPVKLSKLRAPAISRIISGSREKADG